MLVGNPSVPVDDHGAMCSTVLGDCSQEVSQGRWRSDCSEGSGMLQLAWTTFPSALQECRR